MLVAANRRFPELYARKDCEHRYVESRLRYGKRSLAAGLFTLSGADKRA
jgi:hypothetical protein